MSNLYIVPTPIGNLKDITLRAIEVLNEADLILSEDTRTTQNLLKHFDISTKTRAYHQHNEHVATKGVIEELLSKEVNYALVSDAGTPGISDPGFLLIRACVKEKINVVSLPGPTAFVPAITKSGFPCDRFVFEGFLPHKKGRAKRLAAIKEEKRAVVLYESPHRILRLLKETDELLGSDRLVSVSREISKIYEETKTGSPADLHEYFSKNKPKGEFVVVIDALK
ncbi:MAG: 16S rRNA (cytidine(1402)-2'-O)-methyltransferase [Parvicellaceae bacterium]